MSGSVQSKKVLDFAKRELLLMFFSPLQFFFSFLGEQRLELEKKDVSL